MNKAIAHEAFHHAGLKIDRAARHANEAQHTFKTFAEGDFYDIIDDTNPETGNRSIKVATKPIPAQIPLAIGDFFHCLNASLDYAMSGLMRSKTGNATRIHFPTDESRKALRDSFRSPRPGKTTPPRRRIVEAFPKVALELLTSIKPYPGGDFGLWEIRKADNIDKHNLIIPAIGITEVRNVDLYDKVNNVVVAGHRYTINSGGTIGVLTSGEYNSFEFTNKGEATASICFSDTMEVFGGKPVFPTMLECMQLAEKALVKIRDIAIN